MGCHGMLTAPGLCCICCHVLSDPDCMWERSYCNVYLVEDFWQNSKQLLMTRCWESQTLVTVATIEVVRTVKITGQIWKLTFL